MFSGCAADKDQVFLRLSDTWNDLSDTQKQKIMVVADILPPEIEAQRPSPPYRKNLCDWLLLSAARYVGLENFDITSLPPAIKEAALRLPMLRGTVVSEDGDSVALYVPIENKHESHRISQEIEAIVAGFGDNADEFYITGLPVAEDTFGVEMFKQMAMSAPVAAINSAVA